MTPSDYTYQDASPSGLKPLRPGQDLSVTEEAEETDKYNFALGNFRFGFALGVGLEFNDNIKLAQDDRISDFIFRPVLNIDSEWRISDLNTLRFNVGLSYAKYFSHSEFDTNGVLISPNSELALTFYTGAVKWTVRDRISYQEDTYDVADISNAAVYARWENQAGLEGEWAINQAFKLNFGYDHYNLWTTQDTSNSTSDAAFQLQDRAIDTVFVKPSWQLNPAIRVGVNGSYSFIDFKDSDRQDGKGLLVGPFIEWQISEYTNLYLEGGYQQLSFDGGSDFNNADINQLGLSASDAALVRGTLQDNEDSNSYYIKFEINNRPSEFFRHRVAFSKTAEVGFLSDYITLYNVEYDADWKVMEKLEFGPSVFYEHYTTSGSLGEKADRIGAALGLRYHFSNSLTLGLDYRYIWKDSNLDGQDYYQNLVFLSLYYKF
ncbi:MAG: outer membrane beta-barrel protein [Chthoniobacter sp.]|uniref:outer membrane beta-barrel protein n=1 Tax=Chthoniobacter sp. TaxID=2510640 RepID=UPI0032A607DE